MVIMAFLAQQTAAVIAPRVHSCIGLFCWLRLKPWVSNCSQVLFSFALLIPVLSILGYIEGGREVLALFENKEWRDTVCAGLIFHRTKCVHKSNLLR
jgi:hypothetical protein